MCNLYGSSSHQSHASVGHAVVRVSLVGALCCVTDKVNLIGGDCLTVL